MISRAAKDPVHPKPQSIFFSVTSESIFDCFTGQMEMFEEQYLSNQSELGHAVLRV